MGRKAAKRATAAAPGDAAEAVPKAAESAAVEAGEGASASEASSVVRRESELPRGRPVSGRTWKKLQTKKTSMQVYDATPQLRTTWARKQEIKRKRERAKEVQREVEDEQRQRREEEKKRLEERRRRREDNEMRAGKFQVLSNPEKIKKMSKRQLRMIRKTQVDKNGKVQLVSPWS